MSYKDDYEKAKKANKVHQMTHAIKRWNQPGDEVLGEVITVGDFTKGKFDSSCKQYLIDTDEGLLSCVLGAAADSSLEGEELEGRRIRIEYKGMVDLEDGRRCNQFEIEIF